MSVNLASCQFVLLQNLPPHPRSVELPCTAQFHETMLQKHICMKCTTTAYLAHNMQICSGFCAEKYAAAIVLYCLVYTVKVQVNLGNSVLSWYVGTQFELGWSHSDG